MKDLLADSIYDPNRPLSISPEKWEIIKQQQNEQKEKNAAVDELDPLSNIDNSIDGIVQYINLFNSSIEKLDMKSLPPKDVAVIYKIKDLMDTAVSPYVSDIIKELEELES